MRGYARSYAPQEWGNCHGQTTNARQCTRRADVDYLSNGVVIAHYCTQHAKGAGIMRMLLPRPWEYDTIARCPR